MPHFRSYDDEGNSRTPAVPILDLLDQVLAHPEATKEQKDRAQSILKFFKRRVKILNETLAEDLRDQSEAMATFASYVLWNWPDHFAIGTKEGHEAVVTKV